MKISKKKFAVILSSVFLLGVISTATAASTIKEIKASIDYAVTMTVNGMKFNPMDAKGKELKPIIFNDTYYVPIKVVADTLKVAVSVEKKNINFGERSRGVDLVDSRKFSSNPYRFLLTKDADVLNYNGKVFKAGIVSLNPQKYYNDSAECPLDGKFQTISFKAFVIGNGEHQLTVKDQNNVAVKVVTLKAEDGIVEYNSLDVQGVKTLKFELKTIEDAKDSSKFVVADIFAK